MKLVMKVLHPLRLPLCSDNGMHDLPGGASMLGFKACLGPACDCGVARDALKRQSSPDLDCDWDHESAPRDDATDQC